MNLPQQSFISFTVHPAHIPAAPETEHLNTLTPATARLKPQLSAEINFIMCARRGDETEYKLYRFQHADGRRCGAPSSPALGTSLLSAVKQEALKVGRRVMELPVETYCGGQAQGRPVRRPVSERSHPQPAFVFLTRFCFVFFSSRICSGRGQSL